MDSHVNKDRLLATALLIVESILLLLTIVEIAAHCL